MNNDEQIEETEVKLVLSSQQASALTDLIAFCKSPGEMVAFAKVINNIIPFVTEFGARFKVIQDKFMEDAKKVQAEFMTEEENPRLKDGVAQVDFQNAVKGIQDSMTAALTPLKNETREFLVNGDDHQRFMRTFLNLDLSLRNREKNDEIFVATILDLTDVLLNAN